MKKLLREDLGLDTGGITLMGSCFFFYYHLKHIDNCVYIFTVECMTLWFNNMEIKFKVL